MDLSLRFVNDTPAFILDAPPDSSLGSISGVARVGNEWRFSAYYPLGMWAWEELYTVLGRLIRPTPEAQERIDALVSEDRRMTEIERRYGRHEDIDIDLPDGFKFHQEPYEHQRYGIARGLVRWRDFLKWEMGTGKTKTAVERLRIHKARGESRRLLVVAPPVVLPTWEREVHNHSNGELTSMLWLPSDKVSREELIERAQGVDVVVVSYARVRDEAVNAQAEGRPNYLLSLEYDEALLDEGHSIGNWESQQTRAALILSAKARRRYILTGSPGDRPDRLYAQLRFLAPGFMPISFEKYQGRYLRFHNVKKHMVTGFKNLDELNAVMARIATRMKKEDCLNLPERTVQDVYVAPGPRQSARYNELVLTMKASESPDLEYFFNPPEGEELDEDAWRAALMRMPNAGVRLQKLLQIGSGFLVKNPDRSICDTCPMQERCVRDRIKPYTAKCVVVQRPPPNQILRDFENPKLEAFEYYVRMIMDEDPTNKLICWGTLLPELDDMETVLTRLEIKYVRVDGSNTSKIKQYEDAFQKDPECRVYLGQVASGVGITLTAANYMIYYSLPFYTVHYEQSQDRNHRPGQTRRTTVYRLIMQGMMEAFIAIVLKQKYLVSRTMTDLISCPECPRQATCEDEGIMPFRQGCIYQPEVSRLIATPELIRSRR